MELMTHNTVSVKPSDLARIIASASPDEFAEIWFRFDEIMHGNVGDGDKKLSEFAKAMAPQLGSNRLRTLRRLMKMIDFHQIAKEGFSS